MFQDCQQLKSLQISNFNTSLVTNMMYMFDGCDSLQTLEISGWDFSSVTEYKSFMNEGCLVDGEPWENLFA